MKQRSLDPPRQFLSGKINLIWTLQLFFQRRRVYLYKPAKEWLCLECSELSLTFRGRLGPHPRPNMLRIQPESGPILTLVIVLLHRTLAEMEGWMAPTFPDIRGPGWRKCLAGHNDPYTLYICDPDGLLNATAAEAINRFRHLFRTFVIDFSLLSSLSSSLSGHIAYI